MDPLSQLNMLASQMTFEPDGEHPLTSPLPDRVKACPELVFVHPAILPNGRRIKLLKTLLTSSCERDCYYCPFRSKRDLRRVTFSPTEFSNLFMHLVHAGLAEGVFLSSGVLGGGIRSQDNLLDTADILRNKRHFRGYIHLKIMPGAEKAQVERAMVLADRVSINLEAPNDVRLEKLAPQKYYYKELLQPLIWIQQIRKSQPGEAAWNGHWPSSVTQFVAGGAGESDLELMSTSDNLFRNLGLTRVYYSAFNPILDTPLENQPPTPAIRERRLYQASFLLRSYGFNVADIVFDLSGNLPVEIDPKRAWAEKHLTYKPLEINTADKNELLRIPGVGPKGVEAILRARRSHKIKDLSQLSSLGLQSARLSPYVLLDGHTSPSQPPLW